jgi:TrpR-related protein YerC/YecD
MQKKTNVQVQKFYQAVLSLQTESECANFFDDICSIQELEAIIQRFEVARLLAEGKSYIEINQMTGASTATICRVSKCLNHGDGGYKTVLARVNEQEKA